MTGKIDASKELGQNSTILLVLSPEDHSTLLKFIEPIRKKRICFVTLSRTYDVVEKDFSDMGVDAGEVFILDAITSSLSHTEAPKNVTFIPSPDALTDLNIAIIEILKNEKCDYLIFDSISTLLTYRDDPLIARFTDFVLGKVRELKSKAIFTCLDVDSKSQAVQEISLHFDRIIHMEEFDGKK